MSSTITVYSDDYSLFGDTPEEKFFKALDALENAVGELPNGTTSAVEAIYKRRIAPVGMKISEDGEEKIVVEFGGTKLHIVLGDVSEDFPETSEVFTLNEWTKEEKAQILEHVEDEIETATSLSSTEEGGIFAAKYGLYEATVNGERYSYILLPLSEEEAVEAGANRRRDKRQGWWFAAVWFRGVATPAIIGNPELTAAVGANLPGWELPKWFRADNPDAALAAAEVKFFEGIEETLDVLPSGKVVVKEDDDRDFFLRRGVAYLRGTMTAVAAETNEWVCRFCELANTSVKEVWGLKEEEVPALLGLRENEDGTFSLF